MHLSGSLDGGFVQRSRSDIGFQIFTTDIEPYNINLNQRFTYQWRFDKYGRIFCRHPRTNSRQYLHLNNAAYLRTSNSYSWSDEEKWLHVLRLRYHLERKDFEIRGRERYLWDKINQKIKIMQKKLLK